LARRTARWQSLIVINHRVRARAIFRLQASVSAQRASPVNNDAALHAVATQNRKLAVCYEATLHIAAAANGTGPSLLRHALAAPSQRHGIRLGNTAELPGYCPLGTS
jgi:hypothetical protein